MYSNISFLKLGLRLGQNRNCGRRDRHVTEMSQHLYFAPPRTATVNRRLLLHGACRDDLNLSRRHPNFAPMAGLPFLPLVCTVIPSADTFPCESSALRSSCKCETSPELLDLPDTAHGDSPNLEASNNFPFVQIMCVVAVSSSTGLEHWRDFNLRNPAKNGRMLVPQSHFLHPFKGDSKSAERVKTHKSRICSPAVIAKTDLGGC